MNIPLQMIVVALAGWVNEQPLAVIEYLKEENRVLGEQLGRKRLRFTDASAVTASTQEKNAPARCRKGAWEERMLKISLFAGQGPLGEFG